MARRLQDTDEWKTHFVRGLKGPYRSFWFWLKSACDHAGIWEIDIDEARMRTGFDFIEIAEAEQLFSTKILKLPCGEKWFLLQFCEDQYKTNVLDPYRNTAHRGVVKILHKFKLIDNDYNILTEQYKGLLKPLTSSFKATKDKDLDKDTLKVVDNELIGNEPREENSTVEADLKTKKVPKEKKPAEAKTFVTPLVEAFRAFKEMRVKKRAPLTPRAAELIHMELKKLAGDDENLKIAILDQSTKNSWSDVFPLKNKTANQQAPAGNQQPSKAQKIINIAATAEYKEA